MALPRAWGPTAGHPQGLPNQGIPKVPPITPGGKGKGKGKGGGPPKTRNDPRTGMPVMMSEHEIRAEANAQAWKSIQQMQSALPDEAAISSPFNAQRASINQLVTAHRDWLEKAGQYTVNMNNALAGATKTAAGSGDASAAGGAAAAGGPLGATFAGNVAPSGVAAPAGDLGQSFSRLLAGEAANGFPQAIGADAMARVNQNENEALGSVRDARTKIGASYSDERQSAYESGYKGALEKYKSELAAISAGRKGEIDAGKAAETKRHHLVLEKQARDNGETTKRRVDAAIKLGRDKLTAGGKAKDGSERTAGDVSGLREALTTALNMYKDKGGKDVAATYQGTLSYQPPVDPNNPRNKPAKVTKYFSGPDKASVRRQIAAFKASKDGDKPANGPIPAVVWGQDGFIEPGDGKKHVGERGEYNRRQEAWRYLQKMNEGALHPISTAELQNKWRALVGAPK